jgi:signal transduction histidine kinase
VRALALLLLLPLALPGGLARAQRVLATARVCAIDTPEPPDVADGDPRCERLELPDRWSARRPRYQGIAWYRFEVPSGAVDPAARGGVWLPRLNMNAGVYVDGAWIGDGGDFEEPVAQNWNRPLLFGVSPGRLGEGAIVDVAVFAYRGDWGRLDPILVGPYDALAPLHAWRVAWQVRPAQVASVLALVLVAIFAAVFHATGRNPTYGYLALGAACFFVHSLAAHVREILVPYELGRWLIHTAFDWFAVWTLFAFHRWIGARRRRLERAILTVFVVGGLASALAGWAHFLEVAVVLHAVCLGLLFYALVTLVQRLPALPRLERTALLVAGLAALVIAVRALLIQLGVLSRASPRLLLLLAPLLFLSFGAVILGDFLRTFTEARTLNRELDERVRQRERELERSFGALRRLQDEKVLTEERARIMREMHDGLGSRLVAALSLAEGGGSDPGGDALSSALRDALLEMRLVIDSLDPGNDDLLTVLATLRRRLTPGLEARGIGLRWEVGDVPDASLGPSALLDVLRIVQEAVANALKHSGARTLRVAIAPDALADGTPAIRVEVADDGGGLEESRPPGRGLENMRFRARRLGAELTVRSEGGTQVILCVPRVRRTLEPPPAG